MPYSSNDRQDTKSFLNHKRYNEKKGRKTMGNFLFEKCGDIEGLYLIQPEVRGDARGYFMETYNYKDFKDAGLDMIFVQDNQSRSTKGVLRGLHFQKKHTQGKLVRVISGEVFDAVVDIRKGSKTFGK